MATAVAGLAVPLPVHSWDESVFPATERVRATLSYTFRPLQQNKANYKRFDSSCTLHNDCRLLLGRLCLLLPSPAEGGTKRLRSDTQPTRLFDDRLVYWQCGTVNLDDIL